MPWFSQAQNPFYVLGPLAITLILIWSGIWKAFALWRAAQKGSKWWFIALFVINTAGILEILYLFIFSKDKEPKKAK